MLLNFILNNKEIVLIVGITIFLCYAVFTVFKKTDGEALSNRDRKQLEKNITKLRMEKDSILQDNVALLRRIHLDSLSMVGLKNKIQKKEVSVIRQEKNIKTIKDKYEAVYRLDSVSDDELVRLLSEQHIETSTHKK